MNVGKRSVVLVGFVLGACRRPPPAAVDIHVEAISSESQERVTCAIFLDGQPVKDSDGRILTTPDTIRVAFSTEGDDSYSSEPHALSVYPLSRKSSANEGGALYASEYPPYRFDEFAQRSVYSSDANGQLFILIPNFERKEYRPPSRGGPADRFEGHDQDGPVADAERPTTGIGEAPTVPDESVPRGAAAVANSPTDEYESIYKHSLALLIGIGPAYAAQGLPVLPNAERDVAEVKDQFNRMPWEHWESRLLVGKDATRTAIVRELARLGDDADRDDRVFVYFAGHGDRHERAEESGWILPADGVPLEKDSSRSTWLRFEEVQKIFSECRAKHILLALDCCYSGRITTYRGAASTTYQQRFLRERACAVIASGRGNEPVPDGVPEGHSPFADAFLGALRDTKSPALTSSALFVTIQRRFTDLGLPNQAVFGRPPKTPPAGEFVFFTRDPGSK